MKSIQFYVRDSRKHKLVRSEPFHCGKHEHQIFTCPMRVGSRVCGEQVTVPPFGGDCGRGAT